MEQANISQHMAALGVGHGATADVVRKAWRDAALKSHPDISGPDSTEKMSRINAAYEALRNGVPARPAQHTQASNPAQNHGSRPTSQSRAAPERHRMNNMTLVTTAQQRKKWQSTARQNLHLRGYRPDKVGFLKKWLNIKAEIPVFVPEKYVLFRDTFEVVLDGPSLKKGTNHILLPNLAPQNNRLVLSGGHQLFRLTPESELGYLKHHRAAYLDDKIVPGFTGMRVFLSTS